jgi:predicted XRE-type DNA-binding protein
MNAIEQKILEKITHLEAEQQQRVLDFVEQLMTPVRHYTARELMQMPIHERNAILRAQIEQFADEDFETFEAYSEEDLDATL